MSGTSISRFRARTLAAFVTGLACVSSSSARAGSLQELAAKVKPSVVHLDLADSSGEKLGSGTGFFVSDGVLVTNHHVVEEAAKVTALLSDGRKIEAIGLLADDPEKDLAVVRVEGSGFPTLQLGDNRSLQPGDEVVVIGSPRGLSGSLSAGIVSAIRDDRTPIADDDTPGNVKGWNIQVTAAISPGSSGSPILNSRGEVVAIAVGRVNGGEALNFGIPVNELKPLLATAASSAPKRFAKSSDVAKNLTISAAFFGILAIVYLAYSRVERRKTAPKPRGH